MRKVSTVEAEAERRVEGAVGEEEVRKVSNNVVGEGGGGGGDSPDLLSRLPHCWGQPYSYNGQRCYLPQVPAWLLNAGYSYGLRF